mgnify:FL=1
MWNPFKKKNSLEIQRANYALAFKIVPKVLTAFNVGNISLADLEKVSTFINFADDCKNIIKWKNMKLFGTDIKGYPDKYLIIARFPEPFTLSSPKSGAFIVGKRTRETRYFTLETSFGGCMIVEISGQNRNNTGISIADKEDLTEFASVVLSLTVTQRNG